MQKEIENSPLYTHPLETYKYFILGPMSKIYSAREKKTDWERYGNLLIDKFAIHSGTLYHVMEGLIEHKSSSPNQKKMAYDLFSVNAILRVLMETYITFHHIFVSPQNKDEIHLRFLLWRLDGLLEKRKFKVEITDFEKASEILKEDVQIIERLCIEIEKNHFYNKISQDERRKIYEFTILRKKANWKFNISCDYKISLLTISGLLEQICPSRLFINTYKYSSMHTHSGYLSVEHFENMRGKLISTEYTDPLVRLAIYLTIFIINDMCLTDKNSRKEFEMLSTGEQDFINGIYGAFHKAR